MSRPKPRILLEYVNKKNYKCEQILDAEAIWAVFYKDKPFNLKSFNSLVNSQFQCQDFTVVVLTSGTILK